MIRHIVLLYLVEEATDTQRDAIVEALRRLPSEIDTLSSVEAAADLGLAKGNAQVGLLVEVEDEAAWRAYQSHPAHRQVITQHIAPVLASKASIQLPS